MIELLVDWHSRRPFINTLLIMIVLDVIAGILLSITKGTLASRTSWRGMAKKAVTIIIVLTVAVLEGLDESMPKASKWVAAYFCFTEAISILENAAAAGLPIPKFLISMLKAKQSAFDKAITIPDTEELIHIVSPDVKEGEVVGKSTDTSKYLP